MCCADGTPGAVGADTAASAHSMRAEGRKVRWLGLAVIIASLHPLERHFAGTLQQSFCA